MAKPAFDSSQGRFLKDLGLKITYPRLQVLKILEHAEQRHFTAEEVHETLKKDGKDIGIATVYRILTQFETVGLVKKLQFESGHSVFELHTGDHHDHLVCVQCGFVQEFCDEILEERLKLIETTYEFSMTEHALVIHGICKSCQT